MIRPAQIRTRSVLLLYFNYNKFLNEKIKSTFKAQWSVDMKCWWIDNHEDFLQILKSWIEITVLQSRHIYVQDSFSLSCKNYSKNKGFIKSNGH